MNDDDLGAGKRPNDKLKCCLNFFQKQNPSQRQIADFTRRYNSFMSGEKATHALSEFDPLSEQDLITQQTLNDEHHRIGLSHLNKLAMIKLNGGLGTSMGLKGPKSLIPISKSDTFLSLIFKQLNVVNQQYQTQIPLYLMNSSHTHEASIEAVGDQAQCFLQHDIPKINIKTGLPLEGVPTEQAYCPPGHGDIYFALYDSGVLDQMINDGVSHVFISNSDNLGATIDPKILGYMHQEKLDFLMEVTPKTKIDKKGGTLVKRHGELELLELAQVDPEDLEGFYDIEKFKVFNTNNIWVNIHVIKKQINKIVNNLPVIFNYKQVGGVDVVQLESAMGAALSLLPNAGAVTVGRNRFIPVKTTSDLLILQSDFVIKDEVSGACVYVDEMRVPVVELGGELTGFEGYQGRFGDGVPSLIKNKNLKIDN